MYISFVCPINMGQRNSILAWWLLKSASEQSPPPGLDRALCSVEPFVLLLRFY